VRAERAAALLLIAGVACGHPVAEPRGPEPAAQLDVQLANEPGELVVIEECLVPDKVTLIDFWADWCQACKDLDEKLLAELAGSTDVVVRRIDILDDGSPVARHYDIGVLPHVRVYDRAGRLVYALIGDNAARAGALALEVAGGE